MSQVDDGEFRRPRAYRTLSVDVIPDTRSDRSTIKSFEHLQSVHYLLNGIREIDI